MLRPGITGLFEALVESWQECLQVLDYIDFGRRDGIDYELLRVRLEVQRIRLRAWGNACGLGDANIRLADPRFNAQRTRVPVFQSLGRIHDIFKYPETLEAHGLYPTDQPHGDAKSAQQFNKGSLFRRAYRNLRQSVMERQVTKKARWAVYDGKKFQALVEKLRQCNDDLNGLFPDVGSKAAAFIRNEICEVNEMSYLRLLQKATADEYADISEIATHRIGSLAGSSAASRPAVSRVTCTVKPESSKPVHQRQSENREDTSTSIDTGTQKPTNVTVTVHNSATVSEAQMDNLAKEMPSIDLYRGQKIDGAMKCSLAGPASYSANVTAFVDWSGSKDRSLSRFQDRDKGWDKDFVKLSHASFDLYHRKRFIRRDRYSWTAEDRILFDVESDPKYESVHAGTVTSEGFGLECWDYEEELGIPREGSMFIIDRPLPPCTKNQLIRRLDELCRGGNQNFGQDADMDDIRLKEFVGDTIDVTYDDRCGYSPCVRELYKLLNGKFFTNFALSSSVSSHWRTDDENAFGIWNVLQQIIVTTELAMRMEHCKPEGDLTRKILASLIVSDLWLKNIRLVLADGARAQLEVRKPADAEEEARAEHLKRAGDGFLEDGLYQDAIDSYRNSLEIDAPCIAAHIGGGTALMALDEFGEAHRYACTAAIFDPKNAQAWALRGAIELKVGLDKTAENSYTRAVAIAGSETATAESTSAPPIDSMKKRLEEARAKIGAYVDAIEKETDREVQYTLRMNLLDQDFDTAGKVVQWHSNVHERQVEGLLLFAERMKWPYINELRDYAENAYSKMREGLATPRQVIDWLFGLVLPGSYMAFKIMCTVMLCTPSVAEALGTVPAHYDSGLSLPQCSYWRVRTVLGRTLGGLPGITSLCGWIGPCPPVQFDPPLPSKDNSSNENDKPRHIRVKASRTAPIETASGSKVFKAGGRDPHGNAEPKRGEDIHHYAAEMKDADNWVVPKPPARDLAAVKFDWIRLNQLPLDMQTALQRRNDELTDADVAAEVEYTASVGFKVGSSSIINNENSDDGGSARFAYTLYTVPVFVTLPSCYPGPSTDGSHEVHIRDLPRYQNSISIDRLKDYKPNKDDDVLVINATSGGDAEVLARAWCAEQGRHAIIRRDGGPCYACAFQAATKPALGVGVLIWVS